MVLDADHLRQMQEILADARRICCLCHSGPDGDAIGSLLGMGGLLQAAYPDKPVEMYCKDAAPEMFCFLHGISHIQSSIHPKEGDCFVILDTAEPKLTGLFDDIPELFNGSFPIINIDHHPTNTNFGTVNIIEPATCSACELVVHIVDHMRWPLTDSIATALLTGVYTDTGGLLHSNTTSGVYRTVARLLRFGAQKREIVRNVFRTSKMSTLRLWGRVLEKIALTDNGGAVSAVTAGDFRASGADFSELSGAIDYVNAVPGMRFSLILSEREGKVKGSIRTLRDDVDVAEMASAFRGGGHKKAAGFSIPGKLKPSVQWNVVEEQG